MISLTSSVGACYRWRMLSAKKTTKPTKKKNFFLWVSKEAESSTWLRGQGVRGDALYLRGYCDPWRLIHMWKPPKAYYCWMAGLVHLPGAWLVISEADCIFEGSSIWIFAAQTKLTSIIKYYSSISSAHDWASFTHINEEKETAWDLYPYSSNNPSNYWVWINDWFDTTKCTVRYVAILTMTKYLELFFQISGSTLINVECLLWLQLGLSNIQKSSAYVHT